MPVQSESPEGADQQCDVLVIGGGPAGSTAAALLAQHGHRVTLVEKDRHPRFHIGESLLPANLPLFERLGVADQVRAIGMEKWGAEFVSPWHAHTQTFEFAEARDKSMPFAYQVRRSDLDAILLRNAAARGAEVIEGCRVRDVAFDPDGALVRARHDDGGDSTWRARFLIDASGRDTFLGNRLRFKRRNPRHNSSAMYAHFAGARRHPDRAAGNISIFWFEHGWFWLIPLADGATSVGAVTWPYYMKARTQPMEAYFLETIALCPPLADRLRDALLITKVEATGNYSYVSDRTHGPGYLLLGDAFAFIDPVFSSGVMLAMISAFAGAEAVDTSLRHPERSAQAMRRFDRLMRRGPRVFSWFIYRVTNPTMRDLFMAPRNPLRMKESLLSVLAGDLYGKTPIWGGLLAFKAVYYLFSLRYLRRSVLAWQRRRRNIRTLDEQEMPVGP